LSNGEETLKKQKRSFVSCIDPITIKGRFPGSEGEEKTIQYLISKFQEIESITPGNKLDNSFIQSVPLIEITRKKESELIIEPLANEKRKSNSDILVIHNYTEFVTQLNCAKERATLVHSELIFCGYGIVAEEFEWNDYKDVVCQLKECVYLSV
jgi:hypothetical protein